MALRLVDQVHHVLGRHREDDPRFGWISGLDEMEGSLHPTKGGLRIGKEMNERQSDEAYDERLEWDRDGQYFHYLTKWMHALNRVARITGDWTYNSWAMELAKAAHSKFTYSLPGGRKRIYWKMSIDLSRPLVPSMGHHDPLDGLVTYSQLQACAHLTGGKTPPLDLRAEIADMATICKEKNWSTDDPLGIGGLLHDAYRIARLITSGKFTQPGMLEDLLGDSLSGLESFAGQNVPGLSADYRLPFRELGLSIGLRAVERLERLIAQNPPLSRGKLLKHRLQALISHLSLANAIEVFWAEPQNRNSENWKAHRDINRVMLATSLAPDAFLAI